MGAGVGAGVGTGVDTGPAGVPPPTVGAGLGLPAAGEAGGVEAKMGVNLANGDGEAGCLATRGRTGATSAGTLRTWEPGTASPRIAEGSSTVKACIQSWADATAPAARAPA